MSRYIFSKNSRWYISEVFDPSDSKLQEKAAYYTLTDDVRGPYYATGTSDSVSIGVSYVPVVEPAGAIEAGVIDANGNFQPLSFNGTQASDSGSAIAGLQHKTFNTGHDEPDYGGSSGGGSSMDFYKCASRTIVAPYYRVSGAVSTPACNGDYYDNGQTLNNHPRYAYTDQSTNTTYYLQWTSSWNCWQIRKYSGESFDILFRQNTGSSYDTTQPTSEWNVAYNSDLPLTVTAMTPQTGASWSGYKAVQNPSTRIWTFEETLTTDLVYTAFVPEVDKIYNAQASIEATLYLGSQ